MKSSNIEAKSSLVMTRRSFALAGGLGLLGALAACGNGSSGSVGGGTLEVMITCYPTKYLVEKIGGKHVKIIDPIKPGIDPHGLELSLQQVAQMQSADLVVQIEHYQSAVDEAIASKKLTNVLNINDHVKMLPASEADHDHEHEHGASDAGGEHAHDEHDHEHSASDAGGEHAHDEHEHEEEGHDHAHEEHGASDGAGEHAHGEEGHDHEGHDHGGIDPHFWQDPTQMIVAARAIADKFKELAKDNAKDFDAAYDSLEKELKNLDAEISKKFEPITREKAFITSHTAFGYLAKRYGLHQIGIAGIDPENEPSTQRLLELAKIVKDEKLNTVFFETSATPAVAEALATRTGTKAEELDNLETQLDAKKDYADVMRENADKLLASWK